MTTQNAIAEYITELDRLYNAGNATEHTYRPALQRLLEDLTSGLTVTNEPRRIACGAPDYILTRGIIPVGYVEAKDIGENLNDKKHKEQFDRYKQSLGNIIFTDYLTFQLFENGELVTSVTIGHVMQDEIKADPSHFKTLETLIWRFAGYEGRGLQTAEQLSKAMAIKAVLLAKSIEEALYDDERRAATSTITDQLLGFREVLIHDIPPGEFSDIYAQTIAYGMFAARLNDTTHTKFTRGRAAELIPHSNPFLRKLFQYIAGFDLDTRISWIVDALADLFNHADMAAIQCEFSQKDHDPVIHFYETFLAEYDPALRKSRGVWYTPLPVVRFIVQAVDHILQHEFGLEQGLADNSKIKIPAQGKNKQGKPGISEERELHKVQILDPAAGTGTFLAETVRVIHSRFAKQQGMWAEYCRYHLIPRLNGFEILMASYAMAHFKLDMTLRETGFTGNGDARFRIFLTNTLEQAPERVPELFMAQWLAREAEEARRVKRDIPVMVVMGNPPYSGESQNKNIGTWLNAQMDSYKKEPSGEKLQEKNSKWLNNDYVKFICLGQHFIEKNGSGILAFINSNSFLDSPTFRGMRWNLLKAFDKIYILDLHGNSKKKETAPDGGKDENVFDITEGVSINIFVKSGKKKEGDLAEVFHYDLFGKRMEKGDFLENNTRHTVKWKKLKPNAPYYFFKAKDFLGQREYKKGFSVKELFPVNSIGIVSARDHFTIQHTARAMKSTIHEFLRLNTEVARDKFDLGEDTRDWSVAGAKQDLTSHPDFSKIVAINYRPFDKRFTYYTGNSKGFHCMPRGNVMQHFLKGENVGLTISRQTKMDSWGHIFVTNAPTTALFVEIKDNSNNFPLYLYREEVLKNGKERIFEAKTPNMNTKIVSEIAERLNLKFTEEKEASKKTFAPIDILDYIYAVLHCPTYRERYKEFLKIDFPRVPYPEDVKNFQKLVKLGARLRQLHLMEGVEPLPTMANYPVAGSNEVEKWQYVPGTRWGRVYINDEQYFDHVPSEAWEFYIGGYQPAQKWLKDRKGRKLNYDDIQHYRKIIRILKETGQVMLEIGEVMR